jgi:plastocyanin
MSRTVRLVLAAAAVAALGGCAIWGPEGGPGGAGGALPTSSASELAVLAVMGTDGMQHIEITVGDDLRMNPSVVRAHTGKIVITFHNAGTTPHDLSLDAPGGSGGGTTRLGESGNLDFNASATITVDVSTPGTYPMPCLYHETSGMVGTLIVE